MAQVNPWEQTPAPAPAPPAPFIGPVKPPAATWQQSGQQWGLVPGAPAAPAPATAPAYYGHYRGGQSRVPVPVAAPEPPIQRLWRSLLNVVADMQANLGPPTVAGALLPAWYKYGESMYGPMFPGPQPGAPPAYPEYTENLDVPRPRAPATWQQAGLRAGLSPPTAPYLRPPTATSESFGTLPNPARWTQQVTPRYESSWPRGPVPTIRYPNVSPPAAQAPAAQGTGTLPAPAVATPPAYYGRYRGGYESRHGANAYGWPGVYYDWFVSRFGEPDAYYTEARGGATQAKTDYQNFINLLESRTGRPWTPEQLVNVLRAVQGTVERSGVNELGSYMPAVYNYLYQEQAITPPSYLKMGEF